MFMCSLCGLFPGGISQIMAQGLLALTVVMPVRCKFARPPGATKKKHISEISVSPKTILRYRSGTQLFYKLRKFEGLTPFHKFFPNLMFNLASILTSSTKTIIPFIEEVTFWQVLTSFTRGAVDFLKFQRRGTIAR